MSTPGSPPLSPYQKHLFFFLSVATFFDGFDALALSQILPNIRREMGLVPSQEGLLVGDISIGPLLYIVGKLLDRLGRRRSSLLVYGAAVVGALGAFTATTQLMVTLSLILVIGVASANVPILNAIATELFPTELRADAYAWSRNLLGRMGMVVSPLLIGSAAAHMGWATTLRLTVIGPLLALLLIWTAVPETSRRELEETSELKPQHLEP